MKRKRRKKILVSFSIILVLLVLAISIYFIMENIFSDNAKLKKIGYNETQIKIIMKDDNYLNYALTNDFNQNFIELIDNEAFIFEKLELYLKYLEDNVETTNISDTIYLINNDIDYPYSKELVELSKGKYFLKTRIERYLNYLSNNNTLSIDEIIKRVNSDIDYSFYTNIVPTDTSYGYLLICNKHYQLSSTYTGNLVTMSSTYDRRNGQKLDSVAYEAFKKLSDDARSQGLNIVNQSAYRSYSNQSAIYNSYLRNNGQTWTDKWSARPGHSEHQTGLALDVATYKTVNLGDFEYTNEFVWMKANAHKYGFILRYPEGQEYITGYGYEPWHYRYVGVDAATTIYEENITFEEYFTFYVLKK